MPPWSILQYFWPALSDNRSVKPILVFCLSGRLRQVLLYLDAWCLAHEYHEDKPDQEYLEE